MSRRSALSAADVHLDLEPLLRAGSRTAASGILDTASAPEKAGVVVRREAASVLRKHLENTRSACALIADAVSMPPGSATSWRALVCELNTQLTVGLTNAPGGYRRHATPAAYQQVPVSAVEAYFGEACGIIARQDRLLRSEQLPGAWGIGLAAFAVWAINIHGHVFADGCGRTSLSLSALLLLRYGLPVPRLISPAAMYQGCYGASGRLLWSRWYEYFQGVMPDGASGSTGRPAEPVDRPD